MKIRNLGFRVSEDRHRRYHVAARLLDRKLKDVAVELLDAWSDETLRGMSLTDLIADSKKEADDD